MTFTPAVPAPAPPRPKFLTFAAVGVIVVSAFCMLNGVLGPLGVVFSRHHPLAGMPGVTPEMTKMIDLQQKAMSGPMPMLAMVVGVAGIAAGGWAARSAVRVLGAKPGARPAFRRSTAALAVIELTSLVLSVWLQIKTYAMLGELMDTFFGHLPTTGGGIDETMKAIMQGGALIGLAVAIGYGLLKLGFLVWSFHYASSREVAAHLDR